MGSSLLTPGSLSCVLSHPAQAALGEMILGQSQVLGRELKGHGYLNWLNGIPGWRCSSVFTLAKGNRSQALSRAQQMDLGP